MSDALREIFAEFSIAVDLEALDKFEKRLREVIGAENATARAADAAGKAAKKKAEDAARAADKEAAHKAKLIDVEAARQKAQDSAKQAQTDHEGQKLFDASDEGKAHAAWKRLAEVEAAAQQPVTGLLGLLDKFQQKTTASIGQRLPQSLQKVMQGLGVVDGDFAAMGQIAVASATTAAAAVLRIGMALHSFANSFAAASEQLRDVSADAGVTTSEFQSMAHAGIQSGVGADRLTRAMTSLHQQMQAGRLHGGGINWTLRRLGVESRTAGRGIRSASDVMNDLAQSFDRIQNPIRKDRIGVRMFGQDWYRLRDVMHGGEGGIASLRAQMEALGGGVLPEAVEASRRYTQATGRLNVAQDSLRSVLAVGVLPAFTWLTEKAALLTGWWSRMTRGTQLVQVGLAGLAAVGVVAGGALLAAFGPVLVPFVEIAAAIGLVWLVLDDLVTAAKGGNSVFADMVDTLFGVGTTAQIVHDLHDAWRAVVDTVKEGIEAVREFISLRSGGGNTGAVRGYVQGARGAPGTGAVRTRLSPAALASLGRGRTSGAAPSAAPLPLAPIPGTIPGTAPYLAPIPLTRSVAAPGGHGAPTIVRHVQRTNHNVFHLSGPNPEAIARDVSQILERQAREQRDADHPQPGDDD